MEGVQKSEKSADVIYVWSLFRLDLLLTVAALELVLLVDPLVFPHHRGGGLAYAAVPALVPLVRGVDFQLVPVHVGVLVKDKIARRARVLLHLPVRRFVVDLSKGTYTYDVHSGQGMGYTQYVLIGTG